MTQHMGMMDFSDEEEKDDEEVVGYLQLLPPLNRTLGWTVKEFKDGERLLINREDRGCRRRLTTHRQMYAILLSTRRGNKLLCFLSNSYARLVFLKATPTSFCLTFELSSGACP